MAVDVTLTWSELRYACTAAIDRRIMNLQKDLKALYGSKDYPWEYDIRGCIAELAVSKWANQYWEPVISGNPHSINSDVGKNIQVRSIESAHHKFIFHPIDKDDPYYILVLVPKETPNKPQLLGYMQGREGKNKNWWLDPTGKNTPAYFVPQPEIHKDFDKLYSILEATGKTTEKKI